MKIEFDEKTFEMMSMEQQFKIAISEADLQAAIDNIKILEESAKATKSVTGENFTTKTLNTLDTALICMYYAGVKVYPEETDGTEN